MKAQALHKQLEQSETPASIRPLLTLADMSAILHMTPGTIKNKRCNNPLSLPPACNIPGSKTLLWRPEDVEIWLEQFVEARAPIIVEGTSPLPKRKPGRPTKSEQLARGRSGGRVVSFAGYKQ
jgi:hypothetical protein